MYISFEMFYDTILYLFMLSEINYLSLSLSDSFSSCHEVSLFLSTDKPSSGGTSLGLVIGLPVLLFIVLFVVITSIFWFCRWRYLHKKVRI